MQVIVAVLFLAAAANAAAVVPVESSVVKSDRVGDNFAYSIHSTTGVVPDVKHVVPTTYVAGVPVEVRDGEVVRKVIQSPYLGTVPVRTVVHDPYVASGVPVVNPVVNPVVHSVVNPVVHPVSYLPYTYGYGYPYNYNYPVVKV